MSGTDNLKSKSCGACKYYEIFDQTCRIRSLPQFPKREPSEYCHEFAANKAVAELALEKLGVSYPVQLEIDKDEAWQEFLVKLKASTTWPNRRQAEKLFRRIAAKYSLTKLSDFEKITSAEMLEVTGIGKQWVYQLSAILADSEIFNTTVLSRTGEQI